MTISSSEVQKMGISRLQTLHTSNFRDTRHLLKTLGTDVFPMDLIGFCRLLYVFEEDELSYTIPTIVWTINIFKMAKCTR